MPKNLTSHPMIGALGVVVLCIIAIKLAGIPDYGSEFLRDMAHSTVQLALTVGIIVLSARIGLLEQFGLTRPISTWTRFWWAATLPMALLGLINLLSVDWDAVAIDGLSFAGWTYNSVTTGLFEELLLRGFCFAYLFRAWQNRKGALVKAGIAQALIFGIAHLVNLQSASATEVLIQVVYATLFGVGFAGIVAFAKTLWPAIAIHALINGLGDINAYFVRDYVPASPDIGGYMIAILVIFIVATLPGLFLLRRAQAKIEASAPQ